MTHRYPLAPADPAEPGRLRRLRRAASGPGPPLRRRWAWSTPSATPRAAVVPAGRAGHGRPHPAAAGRPVAQLRRDRAGARPARPHRRARGRPAQPRRRGVTTVDINRLTQKSQEALHDAQTAALRLGHTEVDGEHLLLALLDQPDGLVPRLLTQAGADPEALRSDVEARAGPPAQGHRAGRRARAGDSSPSGWPGCSTRPSGRPSGSRTSTSRSSTCCSRWPRRAQRPRPGGCSSEHGVDPRRHS